MQFCRRNLAWVAGALAALGLITVASAPVAAAAPLQTKSVGEIFAAARSAMLHVKNFHVEGSVPSLKMDLSLSGTGDGGSVTTDGATLDIVVARKTIYIKADAKSWQKLTGNASIAKELANKWIKAPANTPNYKDFADLTIIKDFMGQFFSSDQGLAKVSGTEVVNGEKAFELSDGQGDSVYIADQGPPYVLQVTGGGSQGGALNFSDFGDAPIPAVPASAISEP